ncbi:hypothetical protein [Streptomyces sp. NPDC060243]|uniref:hypothetical protein n=1 Tax=Streptomyces sp. NPDC060243 TaxID=3347081 RepID=UPI00365343E4
MSDLTDWLSASTAVASAAAAGFALLISRKANATAETVARLEAARWRHDMTPQFRVTATRLNPAPRSKASLVVELVGPHALDRLDHVSVEIRDDGYTHQPSITTSAEQIAATVWGPYRLEPRIDGAADDGRTEPGAPLAVGAWRKLQLEPTPTPIFSVPEMWEPRYAGAPVRLLLHCRKDGHEPWALPYEVDVTRPAQVHRTTRTVGGPTPEPSPPTG